MPPLEPATDTQLVPSYNSTLAACVLYRVIPNSESLGIGRSASAPTGITIPFVPPNLKYPLPVFSKTVLELETVFVIILFLILKLSIIFCYVIYQIILFYENTCHHDTYVDDNIVF